MSYAKQIENQYKEFGDSHDFWQWLDAEQQSLERALTSAVTGKGKLKHRLETIEKFRNENTPEPKQPFSVGPSPPKKNWTPNK